MTTTNKQTNAKASSPQEQTGKAAKAATPKKPANTEQVFSPVKDTGDKKAAKTPKQKGNKDASDKRGGNTASTARSSKEFSNSSGKGRFQKNYPPRQRNFYNPPQKVLRHLAQQSYYDNFYGNQGQFYTLKQKYKTQLCRHFTENGSCPLAQYCQFAHGPEELRQANDPLPKNFGKTALGAVHSNYKTIPCKYWIDAGKPEDFHLVCKFGDSCSFYHNEAERRELIDPLPNLPEGVTLPPMPEKLRFKQRRYGHKKHAQQQDG